LPSPQQIASSAPLSLAAAWLNLTHRTNLDQLRATLPVPPGSVLPDGTPVDAAVALLRASKPAGGVKDMIGDARVATRLLPDNSHWQAVALCTLGAALRHDGDAPTGRIVIEEAYGRGVEEAPAVGALCLTQLAWLSIGANDWHEAESDVRRARALLQQAGMASTWAAFGVFATSALLAARFGDTSTAADHVRRALTCGDADEGLAPVLAVEARILLARTLLLMGEFGASRRQIRVAASLAQQLPGLGTLTRRIAEAKSAIEVAAMTASASAPLTPAEARILTYLPTHLSFQAIGRDLTVSANTVKTHAVALYRKLGVSCRADAVRRAQEQGLLPARSDGRGADTGT
jgi:LuxR family maltose regulon positive regulatory protein